MEAAGSDSNSNSNSKDSSSLEISSNYNESTNLDMSIDQSSNHNNHNNNREPNVERIELPNENEKKIENFEETKKEEENQNQNEKNKFKRILFCIKMYIIQYFTKWKGTGKDKRPPLPDLEEIGWSWLSSFIGILVLAFIHYREAIDAQMQMLIGSFAASAVIIFAVPKSPLAQPRNLVLGHFLSAIVGSVIRVALVYTKASFEVACALAVSLSITIMQFTNSLHPPGGATALICVMGVEQRWRGFYFIFVPITSGALIMLVTALIVNNFARKRSYPLYWW